MSKNWWYVEGSERKGPIAEDGVRDFLNQGKLNLDSYIWTKGFDNWVKLGEVDELKNLLTPSRPEPEATPDLPSVIREENKFDPHSIGFKERVFYIKTGVDRNTQESGAEYGPFSIEQLERLYKENRINGKTYVFTSGMSNWVLLADFELIERITKGDSVPTVDETERRNHTRKPFVANMYFHDQNHLYKGVCRDISIGGLQVLVSDFPGRINDEVTMNVHPANTDYNFVASGKIVRILEGNCGFSLRFDQIPADAEEAIKSYLQNN